MTMAAHLPRHCGRQVLANHREGYHRWITSSLAILTFISLTVLYASTAAPDVLSGDGGEFQTAAPLLAVPHPTGYPLYILLGKLATSVPIGSLAYRVTLVSVVTAALCVVVLVLIIQRITGNHLAALVGGGALAISPGLWNVATIAEVYALNALLILALAWLLMQASPSSLLSPSSQVPPPSLAPPSPRWLYAAACVTGLGVSLHGSFAFIGAPLLLGFGIIPLIICGKRSSQGGRQWAIVIRMVLWGAAGMLPWLFILLQYARQGPFNGIDHGLHRFQDVAHPTYFWGAPISWYETLDHLFGGVMRGGVFQLPSSETLRVALPMLWERLWFEVGLVGGITGSIGCLALLWMHPRVWLGSMGIASATVGYFLMLGQAVQDALVFTLPFLLPWSLWVGVGAATTASMVDTIRQRFFPSMSHHWQPWLVRIMRVFPVLILLALTLAWGYSRMPYSDKHHLWLFRTFGEGVLANMEPDSVVMVRWEQGTILYYLRLVEGKRPDVWVDIVEPEDEDWQARAERRYADDVVYVIGNEQDGLERGLERVWGTEYAVLYRLSPAPHLTEGRREIVET